MPEHITASDGRATCQNVLKSITLCIQFAINCKPSASLDVFFPLYPYSYTMRQYIWLRNTVRNKLKNSLIGKALVNLRASDQQSICFVSATRHNEKDFWNKSLLGRSLSPRLNATTVKCRITFTNTRGLSEVYNEAIRSVDADILVFIHDDVWLEDPKVMKKIRESLRFNDIVGVAGNVRRRKNQTSWIFLEDKDGRSNLDHPYLSGSIKHGEPGKSTLSYYGPTPARCQLMDGVFLAANRNNLRQSGVEFDPQFKFHFYDIDFCRSAAEAGLTLSTWPIDLIHISAGAFTSPMWLETKISYLLKWP